LADDGIQLVLPAHLASNTRNTTTFRISVSTDMHEKVQAITSSSHPDSIGNTILLAGGRASTDVVVPAVCIFVIIVEFKFINPPII
jgi:hypothetical protein